eukprot:scaffold12238_cov26-Cyclotella_meneghiniana.AAC.2
MQPFGYDLSSCWLEDTMGLPSRDLRKIAHDTKSREYIRHGSILCRTCWCDRPLTGNTAYCGWCGEVVMAKALFLVSLVTCELCVRPQWQGWR